VRRPTLVALRALGLGDLLTGVPALRGLARAFPHHRLVLAAPAWLRPLVGLVEAVDEHVAVGELEPLPATLHGADVAVNLHGSGPESHRLLLAAAPRRLVAFHHPAVPATAAAPRWDAGEHELERWCRLLAQEGVPADPDDLDLAVPPGPPASAGATVVHPGAKTGARRWPPERFAAVARAEVGAGRRVVVTGSPDERGLARVVATAAGLPGEAVLAGRTDLRGLAAVVAGAGRVVAGDTGVGHLATAVGTPSVLLFGPTPPDTWGPPAGRRQRHRVLWRGRTGDPLAAAPFPGLLEIAVDDVLAELDRLDRAVGAPAGR
jgi:ADP-heptose:LPS heptosyltransferase